MVWRLASMFLNHPITEKKLPKLNLGLKCHYDHFGTLAKNTPKFGGGEGFNKNLSLRYISVADSMGLAAAILTR